MFNEGNQYVANITSLRISTSVICITGLVCAFSLGSDEWFVHEFKICEIYWTF